MIPYATAAEAEAALGRAMTWAEAAWYRYSAAMPDYWLHCHSTFILFVVYTIAPLPLVVLEQIAPAVVLPYKLQPQVWVSPAATLRCYRDTACMFLLAIGLQLVSYPTVVKMMGARTGLPLPSVREIAVQLVVYSLVEDYLSYWIHRVLHTQWGYDKIHRVHHEFTAPTGFAMSYSHWAEALVLSIPTLAGPAIVPCHVTTQWLWFSIRLIEGINTHSGYHFPFSPAKLIPFYGGAEYHDYHHYAGGRSQSNFAPIFTYCDYIYRTDKGYRYHKARIAKLKNQAENSVENGSSNAFKTGKKD
uniref:aldehyde oxygenase (deformylating) n=1 Tax=Arundo donax TaxID=35708 RepID=A0A0A9D2I5_ARUDO